MSLARHLVTHRAGLGAAAVAALALIACVAPALAQTPTAERPTYQIGDRWIRSDGTYELKRIDKDAYVFEAGRGNEIRLSKNLELYLVLRDRRLEFSIEPGLRLRWPIEVGRLQRYRVNWSGPLPKPILNFAGSVDITWKVEPLADVTVVAGTFKAHRIVYTFEAQTADLGAGRRFADAELWYAPDVRRLVKGRSDSLSALTFELTGLDDRAPPAVAAPASPAPAPATPPPPVVAATPAPRAAPAQPPASPAGPQDAEGPRITINYPPEGAKVDRGEIEVVGLVIDNVSVDRVLVSVNGKMVTMSPDQAMTQRGYTLRTPVTLRPGQNVIEVSASDKAGNVSQVVRSVTFAASSVAAPPPAALPKSDQWAVVIGISNYENASIPRLKYSVADADAFHQMLVGPMGLKKDNVILLTDRTPRKPTLKNIKWALGTFLSRAAQKSDTVYVFFAGHGAPEADPRGIENDGLSKYLIPQDADPDDLYSTALAMDELQNIFSRIESDRIVVFLDACYSGAGGGPGGGRTFAAKSTRAGLVNDEFLKRLASAKGRAIVTASNPREVSYELPELGHGIFTYYLIEGLKGAADLNRDGIVTLQELYDYLAPEVTKRSRSVGGNQHPVMKSDLEGVLPLTRVKP